MTKIVVQLCDSVSDGLRKEERYELEWSEFVKIFSKHLEVDAKDEVKMFNCCDYSFGENKFIPRKKHFIKYNTSLILDYDDGVRIEEFVNDERNANLAYLLYSSWSFTEEKHAFRVVIPLSEWVSGDDIFDRKKALVKRFDGVDPSTFARGRVFYLPSVRVGEKGIIYHHDGKPLKLRKFKVTEREGKVEEFDLEGQESTVYAIVEHMVEHIPSKIEYEHWRNFCWGVISTGCDPRGFILKKKWDDYESRMAIDHLIMNFRSDSGIGFGSAVWVYERYAGKDLVFKSLLSVLRNKEEMVKMTAEKKKIGAELRELLA